MSGLIDLVIPREKLFFQSLHQQAQLNQASTQVIVELLETNNIQPTAVRTAIETITQNNTNVEEITKDTIQALHKTFITPIDAAEILFLTSTLKSLSATLLKIANWISFIHNFRTPPAVRRQVRILERVVKICEEMVENPLSKENKNRVIEVIKQEGDADELYLKGMNELMDSAEKPNIIMKHQVLLEFIEEAINKMKNVTDEVETVLITHS